MAKFLLLNREEEYVQTLKNVTVAKGNKIINGEDTLDLTFYDTEIEKNYRILMQDNYGKWHEYIVQEIEETHTDKGIRKKVYCESSIYETIGDFIEDRRFNNTSALMALTGVLQHTRWEVGRVDELGVASYSPYRVDAKTAIQTIAKTWKGELQTRIEVSGNKITGRYIDLLKKIGYDTGKRFSWTKDIQQIKRTVVRDDVITALYGFGKGEEVGEGFGRRLDFADINDGKMYVENNEAKEQFGRLDENGNKVHMFGKVEFDDETEKTTLKEKTEAELEVFSKPLLSYSADVLDLKQFGYEHEGYELGDTVLVIDKEFSPELRVLARIIEKETDYLEELNSNVTLGNFIPTSTSEDLKNEGYINNFRDKSGVWDRSNYISEDGRIFIDDLLDQLNAKANATGGYFYYTEGEGTITTDRPIDENPTMAVEIKGGSIRIADSKLPDGSWNWRTAMTGDGITLDAVNTGVLTAGRILSPIDGSYWDLESGVLDLKSGTFRGDRFLLDLATGKLTTFGANNEIIELQDGVMRSYSPDRLRGALLNSEALRFFANQETTNDWVQISPYGTSYSNSSYQDISLFRTNLGLGLRPGANNSYSKNVVFGLYGVNPKLSFALTDVNLNVIRTMIIEAQGTDLIFEVPGLVRLDSPTNGDGRGELSLGALYSKGEDDKSVRILGPHVGVHNSNSPLFLTPSGVGQGVVAGNPERTVHYPMIASSFDVTSDRSYKKEIRNIENPLSLLSTLQVRTYEKDGKQEIGLITDEMPAQLLSKSGKEVALYDLTSLNVGATKEMAEIIYQQETKIEGLTKDLSDLKSLLKEKGLI